MAKGQQRGNREAKKPKKQTPKVIAAAPSNVWTIDRTKDQVAGVKGKK